MLNVRHFPPPQLPLQSFSRTYNPLMFKVHGSVVQKRMFGFENFNGPQISQIVALPIPFPSVVLRSHPWAYLSSHIPLCFLLFNSLLDRSTYQFDCGFAAPGVQRFCHTRIGGQWNDRFHSGDGLLLLSNSRRQVVPYLAEFENALIGLAKIFPYFVARIDGSAIT